MKNFVDCCFISDFKNIDNLFLIDCRFDLFDPDLGYKLYQIDHIPGAFYLDINKDICGKPSIHGGTRPLADIKILSNKLINIGVTMNSTIVVYDEKIYSSPRLFLQLKYMGYKNVYILNGGFNAWKSNNLPTTCEIPKLNYNGFFKENLNESLVCNIEYVKNTINSNEIVLVDSRDNNRYTGEFEPLYSKPGHIPGAINIPWHNNISSNGYVKSLDEISNNFLTLKDKEVILYCGSCIEACINYVLLDELGYNSKVYIGSMSDWISYNDNIVEKL